METAPVEKPPKPRSRHSKKQKKFQLTPQVIIAIVGAIATIVVALINAKWLESLIFPEPTPTLTASPTLIIVPTSSLTPEPTFTAAQEPTPLSPTPTVFTVSPSQVMWGEVDLDVQPRYEGKSPFRVTFNLQRSKFMLASGETVYCRNMDTCQYSWKIYRDGLFLEKRESSDGILVYTFTGYGVYIVVANVCQDTVCAEKQAEIVVK